MSAEPGELEEVMSNTKALIRRLRAARDFPANTCGASRHAQEVAEAMLKGRGATIDVGEHVGGSIAATVAALWEARTKVARLEAERDAARREAMEECARILEALQQGATLANMVAAIREAMEKPAP